jgi:hypothetical protein
LLLDAAARLYQGIGRGVVSAGQVEDPLAGEADLFGHGGGVLAPVEEGDDLAVVGLEGHE